MKFSIEELKLLKECLAFYLDRSCDDYDYNLAYNLLKKLEKSSSSNSSN